MDNVRIDKYLWAIRAFKTRSEAADACNGNKVQVYASVEAALPGLGNENGNGIGNEIVAGQGHGANAKASRPVRLGDVISVRKGSVRYTYRVLALTESRMGAALVPQYAENLTPESELAKAHAPVETFFVTRDRGSGRPTKKERRQLDELTSYFEDVEK